MQIGSGYRINKQAAKKNHLFNFDVLCWQGTEEIDEEALLADEEDLLRVEDEEEEDEESRSWRR